MSLASLLLAAGQVLGGLSVAGCNSAPPNPGQKEFDAANAQIGSFDKETGFGNTPEAKALATRYSATIAKREKDSFEGGKEAEESLTTKGKWLTYCQMRDADVTFLVHAPNLDTYEGDVRKALVELAWEVATELTAKQRAAKDKKLVVALRGNVLFGGLALGMGQAKPQIETDRSIATEKLYPYFTSAAASPAAPPARSGG